MDNYTDRVVERSEHVIEDLQINDNSFSGAVELDEAQLMFFSVPYSDGFEAYVDGEKAEILRANTWGMALDLESGHHTVEFRYRTPGLAAGAVISVIGFAAFAGVIFIYNSKKHRAKAMARKNK